MTEHNSSLTIDCMATDPGSTTIYGIAKSWIENVESVVLLRSIPNPDHISAHMWTIVSSAPDKPLSYWGDTYRGRPFRSVDCTVSSKGAFLAFFRDGQYLTPGSVTVPVGVRYDPETQAWSSIKTSPYYGWTSDYWEHKSFYVNKDGVESAVHMLTDTESTVIRFGVVNEAKNVLQLAGVWKKGTTGQYTPGDISDSMLWMLIQPQAPYIGLATFESTFLAFQRRTMYANGHLYITQYKNSNDIIESYPLTDPTAPPPPNNQVLKGPDGFVSDRFFSGTRGGSTYLGGIGKFNSTLKEYKTYTISNVNGAMQLGPVSTAPFYNYTTTDFGKSDWNMERYAVYDSFLGVGGHLEGQDPFVVGLTTLGTYEFSINAKNISNDLGIMDVMILSPMYYYSPSPMVLTLKEYYKQQRDNLYPTPHDFTAWEIAGIFFGTLIGLVLLVKYIRRRRRQAPENNESIESNARGRRVAQEFAMGTLTPRTGLASGARSGPTGVAATTLHPSITHADIAAYESAVLNESGPSSDPSPEFVAPLDDSDDFPHHATPLPPPTYDDDSLVPEYSRHPQSDVVIPISREGS
ncbi:hypothetical protein BGW39_011180 [Mortierella sp. 14UC]|nr:hypothetical protein BGW39_011180 [Mortierella sp. 14UC]